MTFMRHTLAREEKPPPIFKLGGAPGRFFEVRICGAWIIASVVGACLFVRGYFFGVDAPWCPEIRPVYWKARAPVATVLGFRVNAWSLRGKAAPC